MKIKIPEVPACEFDLDQLEIQAKFDVLAWVKMPCGAFESSEREWWTKYTPDEILNRAKEGLKEYIVDHIKDCKECKMEIAQGNKE